MSAPIYRGEDDNEEPVRAAPPWLSTRRHVVQPPREPAVPLSNSGDRALVELNRQLSRRATLEAGEYDSESQRPMMWRLLSLAGIAAVIAWGIVLLPSLRKSVPERSRTNMQETTTNASRFGLAGASPITDVSVAGATKSPPGNQPKVVVASPTPPAAIDPPMSLSNSVADPPPPGTAKREARAKPAVGPLPQLPLSGSAAAATPAVADASPALQINAITTTKAATAANPLPQSGPAQKASMTATASPPPNSEQLPISPRINSSATATPGPTSARNSDAPRLDPDEIAMLLNRGKDLLSAGDLSAARLLFHRAAEASSAEAALALASTYDPGYLAAHNVLGVTGNEEMARTWYQRAADLGSPEAARALAHLGAR